MATAARAFVRRHPALCYFLLTFVISWGGIFLVTLPTGLYGGKEAFERMLPIWVPVLVLGPSLSGVLMTWLVGGRAGLRDYGARLVRWRVAPRWYAIALLTAPVYFLAIGLAFAAFAPAFLPGIFVADDRLAFVLRGLAVALTAGIVEELGWTGFAVPTLRRDHGPVATGLIVGVLWGAWHILPKIWGAAAFDLGAYLPVDLGSAVVGLTGYRILMVWVYDRTQSLLIGILMHVALTASTLMLQPLVTGVDLVNVGLALTAAPWVVVAAVALVKYRSARRGRPGPTPVPGAGWPLPAR